MRVLAALILLIGALGGCSSSPSPASTLDPEANVLRSIHSVDSSGRFGETGVEIELFSPRSFPVRNEIAVLQIGAKSFLRSRYPDNGDTNVLFFFVSRGEFADLADGDRVAMRYGIDPGPGERWEFGFLDKSRMR